MHVTMPIRSRITSQPSLSPSPRSKPENQLDPPPDPEYGCGTAIASPACQSLLAAPPPELPPPNPEKLLPVRPPIEPRSNDPPRPPPPKFSEPESGLRSPVPPRIETYLIKTRISRRKTR